MACRKAAYHAEVAMSEYIAQQQEIASNRRRNLEERARHEWTPAYILESVCIPWLIEGSEVPGHGSDMIGNSVALSTGCSGGCGKSHPRIVLSFSSPSSTSSSKTLTECEKNICYARMSHRLDPFVLYFEKLCQDGLATREATGAATSATPTIVSTECIGGRNIHQFNPIAMTDFDDGPTVYRLSGFLERHVGMLRNNSKFGYHLVHVSPRDLAASRRAHEHQVAEEEQQERVKRLKRLSGANSTNFSTDNEKSSVSGSVFDDVLQICFENRSLKSHLTMAELSWMRSCGHTSLSNVAAKLAGQRMRDARFTYSVLVIPRSPEIKESRIDYQEGMLKLQDFLRTSLYQEYTVLGSHLPLVASIADPELFCPTGAEGSNEFRWSNNNNGANNTSNMTNRDGPRSQQKEENPQDKVVIRLYLEKLSIDSAICLSPNRRLPESDCFEERVLPIEITRFRIDNIRNKSEGVHESPCKKLTYKVLTGGGGISIESIQVGFQDILGIYARKKLPIAKQEMQKIKNKRPLKRFEKEFVKGIAKLAREMPRSNEPFLKGWQ